MGPVARASRFASAGVSTRGDHFSQKNILHASVWQPRARKIAWYVRIMYAIACGWPEKGDLMIKSLAAHSPLLTGPVADVHLLGHNGNLRWTQDENGLTIHLRAQIRNHQCGCPFEIPTGFVRVVFFGLCRHLVYLFECQCHCSS
jgi:hypothetical protein